MTSSLNRFVFATTLTFAVASLGQAPLTLEEMQRLSIPQLAERGRLAEQKLAALQGAMQESQRKKQAATTDYQAFSKKLWDNQAQLRTRTELLNAVLSNRNRGDLEKRAPELAKKYEGATGPRYRDALDRSTAELLRQGDAETGPRIRIVNPFTNSSHKRFYREDGSWAVAEIKGEADALDKLAEIWQTQYRRAQWAKDEAERAYREYAAKYGEYEATKSELAMVREVSTKRLAEFGRPDVPTRPEAPRESPVKDRNSWIVGTNWAGWTQWYDADDGFWRGYSGGGFVLTFGEGGRCFILKGDDDTRTVVRSQATWRQEGDRVIISKLNYLENVALSLSATSTEAASDSVTRFKLQERVQLKRGQGIKLFPPTVSYRGYLWVVVPESQSPDHLTARP